ncbi:ie-0 [Leucania separata nucleopolyhedrovirus]|uniref:Ie-0 n=1 Tax=Leucania separata nucleopolyhedrovirus TaxID=1307956 RepID=Q0ILB1_NPVLS|nr:ie-0 [Leucania separata nucleopolyhedrovirus]AAR28772.1 ie-0 [Leucania separata nucleopolyhedrovirus]
MSSVASIKLSQVLKDIREMEEYDAYHTATKRSRTDHDVSNETSIVHDKASSKQHADDQRILSNFLFAQMHSDDIRTNSKAQATVKTAAFKIVEQNYCKKYNCEPFADKSPLRYSSDFDENVLLGEDACHHHLIKDINRLSRVMENLYQIELYKLNYFVFIPYLKQLLAILNLFVNDACCKKYTRIAKDILEVSLKRSQEQLDCVQRITKTVQVMNVFLETPLYECGICTEASTEATFLKPNECCGFKICNVCYANMWKFSKSAVHPVCPVCKTSYRSDNKPFSQPILFNS